MKSSYLKIFIALCVCSLQTKAQQFSDAVKQFISVNADTIALTHVKIFDGTGGPAKTDQTILIIKGRISKLGNNISIPSNVKTIDGSGKTVIPGMVMMHEHLFYGESVAPYYLGLAMPFSFPKLYLAGGVTTMRTGGTVEAQTDLNTRNWINEGKMAGPNIDVTAPYIEREALPIPEMLFIKSPEEAAQSVNYWINMGCTSFKAYMDITKEDLKQAVAIAHQHNLKVTGHLCSITYREAAEIGIDNLEHGFMVSTDFVPNKKENVCASGTQ
jgi:imidazolonepropionase-like amidohydrolase